MYYACPFPPLKDSFFRIVYMEGEILIVVQVYRRGTYIYIYMIPLDWVSLVHDRQ